MGQAIGKGISQTSGFRYYFAVLAGICRGPVDQIFLIKSADNLLFDGAKLGVEKDMTLYDPNPVDLYTSAGGPPGDGSYPGGPIIDNTVVPLYVPDLYGGDTSEGGIKGFMWVYMGAKNQLIPAADWIRTAMAGLLLPAFRGVVTTFYDGEVSANNPYPKAWKYRVRRAIKGWDGAVWYPEAAIIMLTDSAIPIFNRTKLDTGLQVTTRIQNSAGVDTAGKSTGSSQQSQISSNYDGQEIKTYNSSGGLVTSIAVPREYNEIYAMNGAHIIYECITNRDWGRGMDRALIDHKSFAAAATTLLEEKFGLCIKWSRTEDIDRFCQTVIDHIGGVVYTDRISGLMCLRLLRADYDVTKLSVFDYTHGLLEITSVSTAAGDMNPNEVIVKYHSPVVDADKEARQQNIAAIDKLGCVLSVSRDYSGLPTSDLAIRIAARDLRIASHAWKNVEFKVDRRGYLITPGDCLILNVPERGLNNTVIRVATVSDSVITDGQISIVGSQDAYGLPAQGVSEQQMSEWLPLDNSPKQIDDITGLEATYFDIFRAFGNINDPEFADYRNDKSIGFQAILAVSPSGASINYRPYSRTVTGMTVGEYQYGPTGVFAKLARLLAPVTSTTTRIYITDGLDPRNTELPQVMCLGNDDGNFGQIGEVREFVYVTNIDRDPDTGRRYADIKRGCIDTYATPHPVNAKLYNYQESALIDTREFNYLQIAQTVGISRSTKGDQIVVGDPTGYLPYTIVGFSGRPGRPYCGANFRCNGYPRDQMPVINDYNTPALLFAWNHRNKETQQDKVFSEEDGDVLPDQSTHYFVEVFSPDFFYSKDTVTTLNNMTITVSDLIAAGMKSGPITCHLRTYAGSVGDVAAGAAFYTPTIHFNFLHDPNGSSVVVTSGFNAQFDQNFGS